MRLVATVPRHGKKSLGLLKMSVILSVCVMEEKTRRFDWFYESVCIPLVA